MSKKCWILLNPDPKGNYLATPGHRYAVLLGVDSRASASDVTKELAKEHFQVTYSWQTGQPNRSSVFIDDWISKLPPPTSGTVWMYFELNFTGDAPITVISRIHKCILFICGDASIAYVFESQDVPDNYAPCGPGDPQAGSCPPLPPPCATCSPAPVPWKPALVGAAIGIVVGAIAAIRW